MRNHLLKKVAQKVPQISAKQGYICCSVMHTEKRKNPITTSFSCSYGIFALVTRTGIEPVLPPWKGGVLAAWPTSRIVVAEVGFEPTTIRVWTERSSQLSYSAMLTSVPKAFILYTIQSVLSIHLIETKLRTGKFFWGKIFLSKSLTNLLECCIIYCTRRCDGTGRRTGLKIYFAVSYHYGGNPWFIKVFDNSICKWFLMSLHDVPPISRTGHRETT